MYPQKSLKSSILKRDMLKKARAVESVDESSTEEKSDDEFANSGSTVKLFQEKRKSFKLKDRSKNKSGGEKSESKIDVKEPAKALPKESSIAQSIKRKFSFFRRSESGKSKQDVEAAVVENIEAQKSEGGEMVDVIVDIHRDNDNDNDQKSQKTKKISSSIDDVQEFDLSENPSSLENIPMKSLSLADQVHKDKTPIKKSVKTNLFDSGSDIDVESEIEIPASIIRDNNGKSIEEEMTSEFLPTSGRESSHHRKRWEKSEIPPENLVESLIKPPRRKWMKETSADVHKVVEKNNFIVSKRSATADSEKISKSRTLITSTPIAAPRSKHKQKKDYNAFENDGYLFDQDEVLRIETIEDSNPEIQMGSNEVEKFEEPISSPSDKEEILSSDTIPKIKELKEYSPKESESNENSDMKEQSVSDSSESSKFIKKISTSKKVLRVKKESLSVEEFTDDKEEENDDDDDNEEDEDEQDTVLNITGKKSKQSSSSSKVEIIPSNFFDKKFTDETTISTNDETSSSVRESQRLPQRPPRSKSKLSSSQKEKKKKKDEKAEITSERSSQEVKSKTTASSSLRNSAEERSSSRRKPKPRPRKKPKKREAKDPKEEYFDKDVKFISVWIHRSDMLEADYVTRHPMVKVHIVNLASGEYLKTKSRDKKETITLQPIITGKFDFMQMRSMKPIWEEELIFEHDFKDMVKEGNDAVLLLFEIIDLLNFSEARCGHDKLGRDACWYKVAWAFLKPIGTSGVHHVDKKIRLQLYRPKKTFRKSNKNTCEVYRWWKTKSRDKYPSSLYVTLSPVEQPKFQPILYDQPLPLEDIPEDGNLSSRKELFDERTEPPKWTRLAAQSCQIPNDYHVEVEASENGCFHLSFSNDGKYLACTLSEEHDYPILVYKVQDGKIHVRFLGHKNFIYSLSWSQDDRFLLSVSSDRTARFWDVKERIIEHVQSLPHPSYVYCGKFSLELSNYVVTGCYDRIARIWALLSSEDGQQYELVQELDAHESFVNTVCFQPKSDIFFTGDGVGVVIAWSSKKSRRSPIRREWQIMRKIKIKELEGVPINTIVMHPSRSRLMVHSRNNGLRLMDLLSGSVIKKYEGLANQRIQITGCISPCGSLILCGGEDSTLNVWNLESSKRLAVYEINVHERAVTCVDYHPTDHILAFAVYGAPVPVKILKFDRDVDGQSVGLKILSTALSAMSISSSTKLKNQPIKNGGRNLQMLSARSQNSSISIGQYNNSFGQLSTKYNKNNEEVKVHASKPNMENLMGNGQNLRAKSLNKLNGIIEKIDRILLYATSHKSPTVDLESGRNSTMFTVTERQPQRPLQTEIFELKDFGAEALRKKKHRHRTRSERNSSSSGSKETELAKAFSDSAAFTSKISRFSDDSSNSNSRSASQKKRFMVEKLELDKIEAESALKDSLGTIIDGKEFYTSEEILDVESLNSDDTYVVENKAKKLTGNEDNDLSEESRATFIIESKIPVPKPRKRIGRIEVM